MAGFPGLHDVPQPGLLQQLAMGHHAPQDRSHAYAAAPLTCDTIAYMHIIDGLIRSPDSSSWRFSSTTRFTCLRLLYASLYMESSMRHIVEL